MPWLRPRPGTLKRYDFFLKENLKNAKLETLFKPKAHDQAAGAGIAKRSRRIRNFALATARLVNSRMQRHWFVEPLTETELEEARQSAQDAVKLAPALAEAHVSLGIVLLLRSSGQYDDALAEKFRRAIELQPNNARALEYSGYVHRRQGRWQECLSRTSQG